MLNVNLVWSFVFHNIDFYDLKQNKGKESRFSQQSLITKSAS